MNRLTHGKVWAAIDALAQRYGLSPSGLAKRAGLDPTAFNKSKRITGEGRARWPTTESIAKVLEATGASFEEFTELVAAPRTPARAQPIPLIRAGTRSASRAWTTTTPMRWRCPATACSRSIATATCSSSRPIRACAKATASFCARPTAR